MITRRRWRRAPPAASPDGDEAGRPGPRQPLAGGVRAMPGASLAEQLARSVVDVAVRTGGAGARTVQRRTEPAARAVLSTVDTQLTALLQRVAAVTFDRLDVPALVRDHVDLDAVVAQVDVEAILAR